MKHFIQAWISIMKEMLQQIYAKTSSIEFNKNPLTRFVEKTYSRHICSVHSFYALNYLEHSG
jgi:hypothetical protein